MSRKKGVCIAIILLIIIITIVALLISLFKNKSIDIKTDNTDISYKNVIQNEDIANTNNLIDNVSNKNDAIIEKNSNATSNILGGRLSEEGITYNGENITYNQKLSSKLNIAYMLKYDIKKDISVSSFESEMDTYINKYKPKSTGLWIENQSLLEGDPLGTDRFISILLQLGVNCEIDANGFVQKIDSTIDICKLINKIIESKKLVMIAFSPDYYAYIENFIDTNAHMTDTEDNYVSFEPLNNIYPYIITGKCEIEELQCILEQIVNDIEK